MRRHQTGGMTSELSCPGCRYDLSELPTERAACPECGRAFTREALAERARRISRVAMDLLAFGALGVVLGRAAGESVAFMPHGEGAAGGGANAALAMGLAPGVFLGTGIAVLAWTTGRTWWRRRWPGALSVAVLAVEVCVLGVVRHPSWTLQYSRALQPGAWRHEGEWVLGVASALMPAAAAAVLLRLARSGGEAALGRLAGLIRIAAMGAVVVRIAAGLQEWSVPRAPQQFTSGGTAAPTAPPPYLRSPAFGQALAFGSDGLERGAWLGLAAAAWLVRAVGREGR